MYDEMMILANQAWEDLMKEKMKMAYEKMIGDKMNKSAQASVEGCMAFWNDKMKSKASRAQFESNLDKVMM